MHTYKNATKFIGIALIASGNVGLGSGFVHANELDAQTSQDTSGGAASDGKNPPATEVIEVRGVRQSLAKSLSVKREETGVVDAIVAEDIGKFPDANVAESLQRIPGVYLERNGASNEGNRITIRGLGPQYAVTTINGAPVHTTSGDSVGSSSRDFNYDVFPSELFGQVTVYKSPKAELTEGGIGGNVDLQTPRPFDNPDEVIRYSLQGAYNDASEETNPKGSFLYSNTWGNFGVLVGGVWAKSTNTRSGFQSTGQYNSNVLGTEREGPFRFSLDLDDPRADLGDYTEEEINNAFLPRFHRAYASQNERERKSGVLSLQYKGDNFDLSFDTLTSKLTDARDEYTYGVAIRNSGQDGVPGLVPIDVFIDDNNNLHGTFGNNSFLAESFFFNSETDFRTYNLRAKYFLSDTLTVRGQVTSSKSESEFTANKVMTFASGVTATLDASKDSIYPDIIPDRDFTDPSSWNDGTGLGYELRNEDDEDTLALLETRWDYNVADWYGNLKVGVVRASSTKTNSRQNGTSIGQAQLLPNGKSYNDMTAAEVLALMDNSMPITPYAQDAGAGFPQTWSSFSRDTVENFFLPAQANAAAPVDFNASFEAEEKVDSVYVQTDIAGDVWGRELKVNVGVRHSDTEVTADNYTLGDNGQYVPNQVTGSYSSTLPSFSASYEVVDDVILRASYGETITRVSLNNIAANLIIPNIFELVAKAGNPNLTPEKSSSKDIAAEWYFAEGALISLGAFWKTIEDQPVEISDFVSFGSLGLPDTALGPIFNDPETGVVSPDLDIRLDSYINGGRQELRGLEVFYQQSFTFLPKPFDGLGMIASVTNVDTQSADWISNAGNVHNIPTVPKRGYSVVGYYEKDALTMRVSYSYKSERYLETVNTGNDLGKVSAAVGYLDASIGYQLTDNLEVRLDGTNLNNVLEYIYFPNPDGLYGNGESRKDNALYSGRTITLGIRGGF